MSLIRVLVCIFVCGLTAHAQLRFTKTVDTIAQLKQLNVNDIHTTCEVKGYLVPGDGGGGLFEYDATSLAVPDTGIRIQPNIGNGLWIRKVVGRDYIARWWNPAKTNATAQAAIDWVSANGGGKVIVDGGTWTVKSDDTTRILMKSNVILTTAEDSQIVCAANPTNNWILIDFPLDAQDCGVGPAKLVGWNLLAPGGDTNKTGVIFSLQDTVNVTIGGVRADNWYTQYADVGSGNQNLQMFDQDWQLGAMAHGAKGDGVTDDRRNLQSYARFCERYNTEFFMRPTTNGYLIGGTGEATSGGVYFTNGVPVKIRGDRTLIKQLYYNPDEGTLQRYSAAFQIYSHNCSIEGFDFVQVGSYPVTETNTAVTGFFIPIVTHMATNVLIQNCTFDVEPGKGILFTGGSYGEILNNTFDYCGITYGNGHQPDWRFYEAAVPTSVGSFSPRGMVIKGNTFRFGTPYKTQLFLSACDDFLVTENYFVDMNTLSAPIIIYSGDQGTTDELGTNIARVSGTISKNFIGGTNFGTEGAIQIRINTPTNFVPVTFDPETMYSAITVSDNHIDGTGTGYNLQNGTGTKIIGGYCKTTGTSLALYGDSDGVEIDGGYYETGGAGVLKSSILFGNAFLAVAPSLKNVKIKHATFLCNAGCEYWMRNVLPAVVDSLIIEDCDIKFLGTAGAGDAPKIMQFQQCTNFVKVLDNRFYTTNGMSLRSIGLLEGTNADFSIDGNRIIELSSQVPRGFQVAGRTISYHGNDMRTFEVTKGDRLMLSDNIISYPDGAIPLELAQVKLATIMGNLIDAQNTNSAVAATIHATNSVLIGNTIIGNSGSDIVRATTNGTMYADRNWIINSGGGNTKPNATGAAVVREHNWMDDPLQVETTVGAAAAVASFSRVGAGAKLDIRQDGFFQTFTRDTIFEPNPPVATNGAGIAYYLRHEGGTNEFAFGADPTIEGAVRIGTSTNLIDLMLGNVMFTWGSGSPNGVKAAPTPSIYFDTNGTSPYAYIKTNGIGDTGWSDLQASISGGATNLTPWLSDIDGNQFSLTNAAGVTLRAADGSARSMVYSNTEGYFSITADAGAVSFDITDNSQVFQYELGGVALMTLGLAGIKPDTASQTLGTSVNPFSRAWLGSSGVNIGGINVRSGNNTPEASIADPVGSAYFRTNGAANTVLYLKETGVGNTGWVPVPTQDVWVLSCSDLTSVFAVGANKAFFRAPFAMTLVSVKAYLLTPQATGSIVTLDLKEGGVSMLSTLASIDNTEDTSLTAAAPPVISDTAIASNAEVTVDITQTGDGTGKGLVLELITHR